MEVLVKNKIVLIDEDFLETFNKFTWCISVHGYVITTINKKQIRLHRLVMDVLDEKCLIDHKDINPLNNMRSNLRKCNHSENGKNTKPRGRSKYLGVAIHVTTKKYLSKKGLKIYTSKPVFKSSINNNGKSIHLGCFKNEIEAAKKYDEYAKIYHGEFANLNFK